MQHASDSKHCRRCGAAYAYDAIYLGHLGRYACPACGQRAARARRSRADDRARRDAQRELSAAHPRAAARGRAPAAGALQRLQRARRRGAVPGAGRRTRRRCVAGLEAVTAAFGRAERVAVGDARAVDPLDQEPRGRQRDPAHAGARAGPLDVLAILNDRIADGRDVSWIWDADFELLAARVRRVTCSGTRAAELALRLKYAGVPAERIERRSPELGRRARRALAAPRATSAVRAPDLHRAARAARAAGLARPRAAVLGDARR